METIDLTGARLDFCVAEAEGMEPRVEWSLPDQRFAWRGVTAHGRTATSISHKFSEDWSLAGPIIEREQIMICWETDHWIAGASEFANSRAGRIVKGPTALVAAMRAYVLSKLGDTVADG